jgi:type IV pilus assembly protein PilF
MQQLNRPVALAGIATLIAALSVGGCQTTPEKGELQTVQTGGQQARVYLELGLEYMKKGDYSTALEKLRRGLEIEPGNPLGHNLMALLHQRLGRPQQADGYFRRALELAPEDPYIHNAYGSFLCDQDRLGEAAEHFALAYGNPLYPTPWLAYSNAGVCARKGGNLAIAESHFRSALNGNPNWSQGLAQMADISWRQQDAQATRSYVQRYLADNPAQPGILLLGVQACVKLGDRETAQHYAKRLQEGFPDAREVQTLREVMPR